MERFNTPQEFIDSCILVTDENRISWIEDISRQVKNNTDNLLSVAVIGALLDSTRYAVAEHHISDYQGGYWEYYVKVIEREDGTPFKMMFPVLQSDETVHVSNNMNYSDFPKMSPITASMFVWLMTIFVSSERIKSYEGFQYMEELKYAFLDLMPEEEVAKLIQLLD